MMDLNKYFSDFIWPWLLSEGLKVLGIIVLAWVFKKLIQVSAERLIRRIIIADHVSSPDAEKKREDTLIRIVNGTVSILIVLIAGVMILDTLGFEVGPILAAAGVAGLALGFGGQYLIRDVISGLFIILENQYRVGDIICFGDTCGLVEDITLRMTTMRDLDGTVHHVPHGEVTKVSNMSKYYARVNLNVGVAYSADLNKVKEIVNRVGKELSQDPEWKDSIVTSPQFLRVDEFADSAVVIKILGDTKPTKQWEVAGELRLRLKSAFDKEGIEIPFPQRVIHKA